jgi:CHAT domain-containing protein
MGMTAAFQKAGVGNMIVSMWPVDALNSGITPIFYQKYQTGLNLPQALQQAKLQLIDRVIPFNEKISLSYAHPFLWANYILYRFYQ